MPSGTFTVDAWVVGGRQRHHRTHDHYGTEPDSTVTLSSSIGKYPAGLTVTAVLVDMLARVVALEGGTHRVASFTASAFILPTFRANAVISKGRTGSFAADAVIGTVLGFSANAITRKGRTGSFTASAVIV